MSGGPGPAVGVHRLRRLVQRANKLQELLSGPQATATQLVLDILRGELQGEPCIAERQAWVE
ncbi:hypothetical protein CTP10_R69230 (plasmid) [Cupriavidus sp. P-10]|uniref:hypothetical protein n=1 Tax=Cupriavidus sp. P-10 TaxID=2027911 RepID=UPI0013141897|nr:hypothetical protein [Cupriavidus sp. P-10]BDB29508.1 hypothetical protein CTP10_R69230 [Cupriavidus sp. P-10]